MNSKVSLLRALVALFTDMVAGSWKPESERHIGPAEDEEEAANTQ